MINKDCRPPLLPLPCRSLFSLIASSEPLHGHFPLLLFFSFDFGTFVTPRRIVTAHWHCFFETTGLTGRLYGLYQLVSLRVLPFLTGVVTTSPVLSAELRNNGCSPAHVVVLPCCLSASQELAAMSVPLPFAEEGEPLRILFIGRLDSYKRLDWLLESLVKMKNHGAYRWRWF